MIGCLFFVNDPNETQIEVHLFSSNLLPESWTKLDQFEGSEYQRILIPVKMTSGICVANIYVDKQNFEEKRWQH